MYSCVPLHWGWANLLCILPILVNLLLKQAFISFGQALATEHRLALNWPVMFQPSKSWDHELELPHLAFLYFPPNHLAHLLFY